MWVMISSDNRAICQQTLDNLEPMEGNNLLIVNGGADDYVGINIPSGWDAIRVNDLKGINEILNMAYKLFPEEEYYGIIPDNCIIETINWEQKIKDACRGKCVVGCEDGNRDPFPFSGVIIWPGWLIRRVGWWGFPDSYSTGFEWAWIKIAWDMVLWERAPDIKVGYIPKETDQMAKEAKKHEEADKQIFDIWRRTGYYKIFRNLMFGGDKWIGRTNFPMESRNDKEIGQNSTT